MGASYPDINRCIYMYNDDRRCRNVISGPGLPHCVYHRDMLEKKRWSERAQPPRRSSAAIEAFSAWLCRHPINTVTSATQALNQVFILVVAGRLSPREANCLAGQIRMFLKSVQGLREEFCIAAFSEHARGGQVFLAELEHTLFAAIAADQRAESAAAPAEPATANPPAPQPSASPTPPATQPNAPPDAGDQLLAAFEAELAASLGRPAPQANANPTAIPAKRPPVSAKSTERLGRRLARLAIGGAGKNGSP